MGLGKKLWCCSTSTSWYTSPSSSSWTSTRSSSTSSTSTTLNRRWGCRGWCTSRRLSSLWRTRWTAPYNWSTSNARGASGSRSWRFLCRFTLRWLDSVITRNFFLIACIFLVLRKNNNLHLGLAWSLRGRFFQGDDLGGHSSCCRGCRSYRGKNKIFNWEDIIYIWYYLTMILFCTITDKVVSKFTKFFLQKLMTN